MRRSVRRWSLRRLSVLDRRSKPLWAARLLDRTSARIPVVPAAVVLDFDGVFTDNKVYVFDDGREAVRCDRGDGWGLAYLRATGLPVLVLSTEQNPVVSARCSKLGLEAIQGCDDKVAALTSWLRDRSLDPAEVIYVGNDVNDLGCFELVGCPVAVADAHPSARRGARVVLRARGGDGAIRELADLIAAQKP